MVALLSIIVTVVGLLMYALSANPKIQEIGRIMFMMGLLAALLQLGGSSVSLGR